MIAEVEAAASRLERAAAANTGYIGWAEDITLVVRELRYYCTMALTMEATIHNIDKAFSAALPGNEVGKNRDHKQDDRPGLDPVQH